MNVHAIKETPVEIKTPVNFFEAATIMVADYLEAQLDIDRYELVAEDLGTENVENTIAHQRRVFTIKNRYNDHKKLRPYDGRYVTFYIKSGQRNLRGDKLCRLSTIYVDFNLHTGTTYRSAQYSAVGIVTMMKAVTKFILD